MFQNFNVRIIENESVEFWTFLFSQSELNNPSVNESYADMRPGKVNLRFY
jgi:hypothetical protein